MSLDKGHCGSSFLPCSFEAVFFLSDRNDTTIVIRIPVFEECAMRYNRSQCITKL